MDISKASCELLKRTKSWPAVGVLTQSDSEFPIPGDYWGLSPIPNSPCSLAHCETSTVGVPSRPPPRSHRQLHASPITSSHPTCIFCSMLSARCPNCVYNNATTMTIALLYMPYESSKTSNRDRFLACSAWASPCPLCSYDAMPGNKIKYSPMHACILLIR